MKISFAHSTRNTLFHSVAATIAVATFALFIATIPNAHATDLPDTFECGPLKLSYDTSTGSPNCDTSAGYPHLTFTAASGLSTSAIASLSMTNPGQLATNTAANFISDGTPIDITLDNVNIDNTNTSLSPITVENPGSSLFVRIAGQNLLKGGDESPGLSLPAITDDLSTNLTSATITSAAGDGSTDGTLSAFGGSYAPGIGNATGLISQLAILGGTYYAVGGQYRPGIGSNAEMRNLTIDGAIISAEGGERAPGIGSMHRIGGTFTISNAEIEAIGNNNAGIGARLGWATVNISDSVIYAEALDDVENRYFGIGATRQASVPWDITINISTTGKYTQVTAIGGKGAMSNAIADPSNVIRGGYWSDPEDLFVTPPEEFFTEDFAVPKTNSALICLPVTLLSYQIGEGTWPNGEPQPASLRTTLVQPETISEEIVPQPPAGMVFSGWQLSGADSQLNDFFPAGTAITLSNISQDIVLTAVYSPKDQPEPSGSSTSTSSTSPTPTTTSASPNSSQAASSSASSSANPSTPSGSLARTGSPVVIAILSATVLAVTGLVITNRLRSHQ